MPCILFMSSSYIERSGHMGLYMNNGTYLLKITLLICIRKHLHSEKRGLNFGLTFHLFILCVRASKATVEIV